MAAAIDQTAQMDWRKRAVSLYAIPQHKTEYSATVDSDNLDTFLATVERRAYLMARTALGNHEDALETVQDAMMMLVKKYRHKSEDDWRLLFFRILNNKTRDLLRRRTVRHRFTGWLGGVRTDREDSGDPFQHVADVPANNPQRALERDRSMAELESALSALPPRQREAFMLRCWEGMSTAETAAIMKCSEGSVKTHYSRALHNLQEKLEDYRDE